jgi:hypothetical protein
MAKKMWFFGFLVAKFRLFKKNLWKKSTDFSILLLACSQKCKGWLNFFYCSCPVYNQIWLNCHTDDCHFSYTFLFLAKFRACCGQKKKMGTFSPNYEDFFSLNSPYLKCCQDIFSTILKTFLLSSLTCSQIWLKSFSKKETTGTSGFLKNNLI